MNANNAKKIVAEVLTASMVLSVSPVAALATVVEPSNSDYVSTLKENRINWGKNNVYTLTADTDIGGDYTISGNSDAVYTINLDTYKLTAQKISVTNKATLNINGFAANPENKGILNSFVFVRDSAKLNIADGVKLGQNRYIGDKTLNGNGVTNNSSDIYKLSVDTTIPNVKLALAEQIVLTEPKTLYVNNNQTVSISVPNVQTLNVTVNGKVIEPVDGKYTFTVDSNNTVVSVTSKDLWIPSNSNGYILNENAEVPTLLEIPSNSSFTVYEIDTDTKVNNVNNVVIGSGSQLDIKKGNFKGNVDFEVGGSLSLWGGAVFDGTVSIKAPQKTQFRTTQKKPVVNLFGGTFNNTLTLSGVITTAETSENSIVARDIILDKGTELVVHSGAKIKANNINITDGSSCDVYGTIDAKTVNVDKGSSFVEKKGSHVSASVSGDGEIVQKPSSGDSNSSSGSSGVSYKIDLESNTNGDITVSSKTAQEGSLITVTVTPKGGYRLDTLTIVDGQNKSIDYKEKSKNTFTFKMPKSNVSISATFKLVEDMNTTTTSFNDVSSSAYYYNAVQWAVKNNITQGTSSGKFSPDSACTRAQVVTFLWRAKGSPEPKMNVNQFTDISPSDYYYKAVLWAVENGITEGTSSTQFSPNSSCTRSQVVTFLWRAKGSPSTTGSANFSDVASDSYYATPVAWAVQNNITTGVNANSFAPNSVCTRGQIVTFLHRALG